MAGVVGIAGAVVELRGTSHDGEQGGRLTNTEKRTPAPSGCRGYLRQSLAKEFPEIVDGFVKAAKSGSVRHVKLVNELLQPTRKEATRVKGPAARFFEKLEQEKNEKERLAAEKE
jgi:hypothetical protein